MMVDAYDYDHAVAGQGRLLDALKALAAKQPIAECYPDNRAHFCVYCEVDSETWPDGFPHADDCPWVAAKALVEEFGG
jgi:hypothetical protein